MVSVERPPQSVITQAVSEILDSAVYRRMCTQNEVIRRSFLRLDADLLDNVICCLGPSDVVRARACCRELNASADRIASYDKPLRLALEMHVHRHCGLDLDVLQEQCNHPTSEWYQALHGWIVRRRILRDGDDQVFNNVLMQLICMTMGDSVGWITFTTILDTPKVGDAARYITFVVERFLARTLFDVDEDEVRRVVHRLACHKAVLAPVVAMLAERHLEWSYWYSPEEAAAERAKVRAAGREY